MTQNEVNFSIDRQLKRIHDFAGQVWQARHGAQNAELRLLELLRPADRNSSLSAGIALLVIMLFLFDAAIASPALADRFLELGISTSLTVTAWAAVLASLVLMLLEMVVAIACFRAYEQSLVTGRKAALVGWRLLAVLIIFIPIGLGFSQLWVVTDGDFSDIARSLKELIITLFLSAAHICLICQGRNLEQAKQEAGLWLKESWARLKLYFARRKERKAYDGLTNEYRNHTRAVTIARKSGLDAEVGPFEDRVITLLQERYSELSLAK